MPRITVTTRTGEERTIQVAIGRSLMEELRNAGIDEIQAVCGGCGACCTCHVYIAAECLTELPPMSEQEDALLDSSEVRIDRSRLSCQIPVTGSLDGVRRPV